MKNKFKLLIQFSIVFSAILLIQGCTLKVPLEDVKTSENSYNMTQNEKVKEVTFKNNLKENNKIITGIYEKGIILQHKGKDLEQFTFIKNAIENELEARKIPMQVVETAKDSLSLDNFQLYTYQSTGFSPFVTFSMLKVTADLNGENKVFSSVIKRGKVPIWSANELFDPCFNEPITLMVKEVVAKINKAYFNYKLSDKKVSEIIEKIKVGIENKDKLNYLNIYELGFSNNPKVLDTLHAYASSSDEYLRLASISMIGLIGGEKQFDFLVQKYRDSKLWQDRALALKAINDIETKESKDFINQQYNLWKSQDTKEGKWHTMLLESYK